jgi:hypothetical protein
MHLMLSLAMSAILRLGLGYINTLVREEGSEWLGHAEEPRVALGACGTCDGCTAQALHCFVLKQSAGQMESQNGI